MDILRVIETSVDGVISEDELAGGGVGTLSDRASPSFFISREDLEGEAGSAVVTLEHNPDDPLCNVPRTGINGESTEASTGGP
jgi:hypothetical protein